MKLTTAETKRFAELSAKMAAPEPRKPRRAARARSTKTKAAAPAAETKPAAKAGTKKGGTKK